MKSRVQIPGAPIAPERDLAKIFEVTNAMLWVALVIFFTEAHGLANSPNFQKEIANELRVMGFSEARIAETDQALSATIYDAASETKISYNGDRWMCAASMGKWACAYAAARLLAQGGTSLRFVDSLSESNSLAVTRGDLQAMLNFSDNRSAERVCVAVNNAASTERGCYINRLMKSESLAILNGNVFNGGISHRCEIEPDLKRLRSPPIRKSSNVGTTDGFAQLLWLIRSDSSRPDWLNFKPDLQPRPQDKPKATARNRLYKAFGCSSENCPLTLRKSGSLPPGPNWDSCFNDSVWYETEEKSFALAVMCNESQQGRNCSNEVFQAVARAALKVTSTRSGVRAGIRTRENLTLENTSAQKD